MEQTFPSAILRKKDKRMKPLYRDRDGICSRGWLFMGENGGPCDQKCEMCYYAYQKNLVFFSIETLIQHANMYRWYYGLDACDITGGEATVYKHIVELVTHCSLIGLRPTIITHGQNIRDDFKLGHKRPLYQEIEEAGLDDWLISLHGNSPESHDRVLGKEGSFNRLMHGVGLVSKPVRYNTTLLDTNYQDLPVEVLKDQPPTVWNPIMFNPFHAWMEKTGETEIDFQSQYKEIGPYLARAIEDLERVGWEVNVRYWPICIAKEYGFEANVCGFHQVPFDPWEWRLNVTHRQDMRMIKHRGGWYNAERLAAKAVVESRKNDKCDTCMYSQICDKPPDQYQTKYGLDEISPILGDLENDPLVFWRNRVYQEVSGE
jgi:MoaA/NifB/PqqE/SkfB family radical SAM enzyme